AGRLRAEGLGSPRDALGPAVARRHRTGDQDRGFLRGACRLRWVDAGRRRRPGPRGGRHPPTGDGMRREETRGHDHQSGDDERQPIRERHEDSRAHQHECGQHADRSPEAVGRSASQDGGRGTGQAGQEDQSDESGRQREGRPHQPVGEEVVDTDEPAHEQEGDRRQSPHAHSQPGPCIGAHPLGLIAPRHLLAGGQQDH
ncbi:hypothetical protein BHE94_18915, partial [Bacillus pumilus]